jgi:hypothetical protein
MTHTQTPWRVAKGYRITGGPQGHTYVASLDNVKHFSPEELDANAAFIVRAVNSHDEMLAALKAARAVVHECTHRERGRLQLVATTLDAAIAQAEAQP